MNFFKNYNELVGTDIELKGRAIVLDILAAGVESVLPERAMRDLFENQIVNLPEKVTIMGWGKASMGMYKAFKENYKGEIYQGHVISGEEKSPKPNNSKVVFSHGAHPIPDKTSLKSGEKLLEIARELDEHDTLVCLISGGGSSMFEVPKDNVSLNILKDTYQLLLESGADIYEVNSIRRAISKSKGGGLTKAAHPAHIINIVISDVPGNNLEDIASGPTVMDPFRIKPIDVVKEYDLQGALDKSVIKSIEDYIPYEKQYFQNTETYIIADNKKAQEAMCTKAKDLGYKANQFEGYLKGESRNAVIRFMETPGDIIVGGGETTVAVKGKGRGGRNQEFVLAGLLHVDNGVLASIGSDGIDGFTEAAGAIGDKNVLDTSLKRGYEIGSFLNNNDSYEFFNGCRGLILTGPTGTNVADICVFLRKIH